MFAFVAAFASCTAGVSRCDDLGPMRQLAIFSLFLVVVVVSVALLVNRGAKE